MNNASGPYRSLTDASDMCLRARNGVNMSENIGKYMYLSEDCIMPLNFYNYKQAFLGSSSGMRYRIVQGERELPLPEDAKEGDKPPKEKYLTVETWPEPYSYTATDKEAIRSREYPFTQEAYEQILADLDAAVDDYKKAQG